MGTKDNFHQALHEVFPFYKNDKTNDTASSSNFSDILDQTALNSEKITPIMTATVPQDSEPEPEEDNTIQNLPVIETAYITKDTKIVGTVTSMSNIDICGEIVGDVESQHRVRISGKIEGNIKAKDIEIVNASIKGNILASQWLAVGGKSIIRGNISANEVEFNSRISGNINVKKEISIQKDACITGDISAMSISVEKGAMIKGMLTTLGETESYKDNKADQENQE